MIREWFYFAVKAACFGYLMWRLWSVLFRRQLFGIWARLFELRQRQNDVDSVSSEEDSEATVLGRTNFVYLEDPAEAAVVPERSEELPRNDLTNKELDIDADDVESSLANDAVAMPPSEEELYDDEHETVPLDAEFARGITFNEIADAVEMLSATTEDRTKTLAAAQTIFNLKNTELFEFLATQVSNTAAVDRLLAECFDDNYDWQLLHSQKDKNINIVNFQWKQYV